MARTPGVTGLTPPVSAVEAGMSQSRRSGGSAALESLIVDDGMGTMLGLAIGDVAVHRDGYTSRTQIATIIAYHLLEVGEVDRRRLVEAMVDLGRPGESVLTAPTPELSAWMETAAIGPPLATAVPTPEVATRGIPVGVWFRDDAAALVSSVVDCVLVENLDAPSIVTAVAVAGAVAGGTLAMAGWDLVLAAAETADRALGLLSERSVSNIDRSAGVPRGLRTVRSMVGRPVDEIVCALDDLPEQIRPPIAAIVAAADSESAPALVVESAGRVGVDASVIAGAILGSRLGLRRWPWRVPNETWFAEVGRRLVHQERETRDLPIPRSVEARVRRAEPIDPASEID